MIDKDFDWDELWQRVAVGICLLILLGFLVLVAGLCVLVWKGVLR